MTLNCAKEGTYMAGYELIGAIHHEQYGVATFARDNIDSARMIVSYCSGNIEVLAMEACGITVINTYKPPNVAWSNPPIKFSNVCTIRIRFCF